MNRPLFCGNLRFIKHVLLFTEEDLSEILADKIPEIREKEISHGRAHTNQFWRNLFVMDSALFRSKTFVSNIGEKRDGVNGVNPVFFIRQSCRHAVQSGSFGELISMKTCWRSQPFRLLRWRNRNDCSERNQRLRGLARAFRKQCLGGGTYMDFVKSREQ